MYQAGIKIITLYENKGINFYYYNLGNENLISNLTNTGQTIVIENKLQPKYNVELKPFDRQFSYDLTLSFLLEALTQENINTLIDLKQSIYGWCMLVEFYDGTSKFYNIPLFCNTSKIDPSKEMIFNVDMQNRVAVTRSYYDYTAGISETTTYRCDSTLLTCDYNLITCDYAL